VTFRMYRLTFKRACYQRLTFQIYFSLGKYAWNAGEEDAYTTLDLVFCSEHHILPIFQTQLFSKYASGHIKFESLNNIF
jgi:hypothetical protein